MDLNQEATYHNAAYKRLSRVKDTARFETERMERYHGNRNDKKKKKEIEMTRKWG